MLYYYSNEEKADWWNGIHRRLKISRPLGLAGSNPASATILGEKMKKILTYGCVGIAIYVGVNWVADNPKKVKQFRNQLNAAVQTAYDATASFVEEMTG